MAAGAVQVRFAAAVAVAVATKLVTAEGVVSGTAEIVDAGPAPLALWAITSTWYAVPLVRPLISVGLVALDETVVQLFDVEHEVVQYATV